MTRRYDLVTMGRSSIDLYSNDLGAPFPEIGSFGAFVGGSPTNIAVGARRLGLDVALLTAVGEDPVGDFVLGFLDREGVDTAFIPRKAGKSTSAVVLGIEPPDRFPLVFYREGCADIELSIDDVLAAPIAQSRVLVITGTGLSRDPSRSSTMLAVERAHEAGVTVVLDVDFRANQWDDHRAFGVAVRAVLPLVDVLIGTEEEIKAAAPSADLQVQIRDSQISSPEVGGNLDSSIEALLSRGPRALVVKHGERGASVHCSDGEVHHAEPFPVEVCNVLGAGDAFASGFIYGMLQGWDWTRCARMGNALGAIVVTRQGCANFMATRAEALEFIESRGGM
ncbi:MAG: 5-dehydro-2-deoxygluconokinase [Myxococcota bacterium]|nr:5-dehydro-2-deoxygluconokinase [Myxococcota bacterium]